MAVKITIAVEKTANDQDLGIVETLNIIVVTLKGECEFLFLIFFDNKPNLKRNFIAEVPPKQKFF